MSDNPTTRRYFTAGGRELMPDEVLPDMSNVCAVEETTPFPDLSPDQKAFIQSIWDSHQKVADLTAVRIYGVPRGNGQ